ncbi:MAG: hypothetical protein H7A21_20090 [Spirochaetales bacterium]|nr:hypothetical protein [Leptospiraceae bacterium]MCP5483750.1 hypothetical protein [Spirochaetales bacterium]MCP5484765.1 hypothetical protein [Spirochaetales bacterium]
MRVSARLVRSRERPRRDQIFETNKAQLRDSGPQIDRSPRTRETNDRTKADYVVVGARAGALHGHVRATEDIGLLIRNTKDNVSRAVEALSELFPDVSGKIPPEDILEHVVLKVADDIEIDVSISA